MARNKFFAFFNTEEEFIRFMFKYINDHPEVLRAHNHEIRRHARIWELDHVTVALGRMGFREKKFREFDKALTEVFDDYMKEYSDDLKCDETMIYSRTLLERELKQYVGSLYVPEEERYA